ncbi:MAG: 50S ribosomal protein L29 [Calditrichia bacterium]
MKLNELRELQLDELEEKLNEALDELSNLKIQKATHQISNPSRIRIVKKDIARCHTLISELKRNANVEKVESE